jgi:hypothetical protein
VSGTGGHAIALFGNEDGRGRIHVSRATPRGRGGCPAGLTMLPSARIPVAIRHTPSEQKRFQAPRGDCHAVAVLRHHRQRSRRQEPGEALSTPWARGTRGGIRAAPRLGYAVHTGRREPERVSERRLQKTVFLQIPSIAEKSVKRATLPERQGRPTNPGPHSRDELSDDPGAIHSGLLTSGGLTP